MTHKTLDYDSLQITALQLYEQMGYHDGALPDPATTAEIQSIVAEVHPWLRPQFCYFVTRQLPPFSMGRIIEQQLCGSEAYACFVCTCGSEFEVYQQQTMRQGDMVRTFIADALGSVIAERCADEMERSLQLSIDKLGWHHTNRFSPGYCGWHVSQQQLLFSLFPQPNPCGVHLTESSLMLPIKSVSGIIGLGTNVHHLDYTCGLCQFEKCYKRYRKRK